ncbi:CRISPR-associated helicase/endonuclease Cas3 [Desulfothermus naphthae]
MSEKKLIDFILAKSDGTTLSEHINDDLVIFKQLKNSLPVASELTNLKRFWELLFCAIFFHDFGKMHSEFQKKLKGEKNYWQGQRHEIYSIPFVYKLDIPEWKQDLIAKAILAHHKSFDELKKSLINEEDLEFEYQTQWKNKIKYHPKDFLENLKHNFSKEVLNEYLSLFEQKRKLFNIPYTLKEEPIKVDTLKNPINKYCNFSCNFLSEEYFQNLMLWAGLKISDHLGSAKIKKIYLLNKGNFKFIDAFKAKYRLYKHQKESFKANTSSILIAPTGSGKTESALGWLKNVLEKKQGRVFYVLPYTASINAMHKRLVNYMDFEVSNKEKEFSNIVGLLHGNISHYISEYFTDVNSKEENIKRNKKIKKLVAQYKTLLSPVIVATPFQLLKYFFGIKGFEKGLFFLSGAKLIFDEIHAYDVQTFAQLIVMLRFLKKYFYNDIFIMTATLPTFMIEIIKNYLEIDTVIYADDNLLSNLKRHKIILYKGDIINFLQNEFLTNYDKSKKYIFVCNTVSRAQEVYKKILNTNLFKKDDIVLVHGRFNQKDRNIKEQKLQDENTKVLVGTQTIEVSLDIDYDVMITEPAPLDALVQRFGRVNRKAKKEISPIYLCEIGGKNDKFVYPIEKIQATVSVLSKINDNLDEKILQELLDTVYPSWTEQEQKLFDETIKLFDESLKTLMPFSYCKEGEEKFYSRFTDIKVLPVAFYNEYKELLQNYNFIEAEKLLVNLNRNLFYKFLKEGIISEEKFVIELNDKLITNNIYVIYLKYSEELGLIDEKEDFKKETLFW